MLSVKVNAKVNLFLDITGKEQSGYHTVDNIMQSVELCDKISVSIKESGGISVTSSEQGLGGQKDIAFIAASRYAESANMNLNADIYIDKAIPVKAGLGGGSADAAAVLYCLEKTFGALGQEGIYRLAGEIGADVPFFLFGGTALCSHYGELITRMDDCPDCIFVIAKMGEKPSTAEMYRRADEISSSVEKKDIGTLIDSIKNGDLYAVCDGMMNIFEYTRQDESFERGKNIFKKSGAVCVHLSGSGPCVFGVFDNITLAEDCFEKFNSEGIDCWICPSAKNSITVE